MALSMWVIYLLLIYGKCYGHTSPTVSLSDGHKMPVIGFGTFQLSANEVDVAVTAALENGYRHIDAAYVYFNEKDVGNALKKWFKNGGKREDLYVTSKLPYQALRPSDVSKALELSLNNLDLDYIDNYLIHVPFGVYRTADFEPLQYKNGTFAIDITTDHIAIWKELEKQVKAGKVKSIGLSNFNKTQILRVWEKAEIKPSNLQVETNAYIQEEELLQLCKQLGIVLTGYSPLGSGGTVHMRRKRDIVTLPTLIQHPVVQQIAVKHNKSPAQILLRYNLQRNIVVIPKSSNPKRIKENIDIFDFTLTKGDMNLLKALDLHGKYRKFDFFTIVGVQNHPEYPFADRISK